MTIKVEQIAHGSPTYREALLIRYEVLRRPLGLDYTSEQIAKEVIDLHFVLYINDLMIGTFIMSPIDKLRIKMRQMAIAEKYQLQGYGKVMLQAAEKFAINNQYKIIFCHARQSAVFFYLKNNWRIKGDEFLEVGIPHFYMEKYLYISCKSQ